MMSPQDPGPPQNTVPHPATSRREAAQFSSSTSTRPRFWRPPRAPRLNPELLADPQSAAAAWRNDCDDAERPLFDRTLQMALPPGSVYKTLTATAMLSTPGYDPAMAFQCQGYLHTPDRQRCASIAAGEWDMER